MRTEVYSAPAGYPLLIDEIKEHLKISHSHEDAYLMGLMQASISTIEAYAGIAVMERQVDVFLDDWPGGRTTYWWDGMQSGSLHDSHNDLDLASRGVLLPVAPVSQIIELAVYDASDTAAVMPVTGYRLQPGLLPRLVLNTGSIWPRPGRSVDGIRIRVLAGFGGSWNDIPASIKQAILQHISYQYFHREEGGHSALKDSGAQALLSAYKKVRL